MPHFVTFDDRNYDYQGVGSTPEEDVKSLQNPGTDQEVRMGIMQSVEPVLENAIVEDSPIIDDWMGG